MTGGACPHHDDEYVWAFQAVRSIFLALDKQSLETNVTSIDIVCVPVDVVIVYCCVFS
jgi:hypothetical protein